MAADKNRYAGLTQRQYEELMNRTMRAVGKKTDKMAEARRQSFAGEPENAPDPKVVADALPEPRKPKKAVKHKV